MCRRFAALLLVASAQALAPTRLRLLTCDLDDTFWPTADVVAAANTALFAALEARGADASLLGETMKRLRRAAGVQMSYTDARTSAIDELLGGAPPYEVAAPQEAQQPPQRASAGRFRRNRHAHLRRHHPDCSWMRQRAG